MIREEFGAVDYENALWGKDIYTLRGLQVRADILNDNFPEVSKKIYALLEEIENYQTIYDDTDFNIMNQRVFAKWVDDVFGIYNTVLQILIDIHTYESYEWKPIKLQERDIIAVALLGAYKNRTDTELFDNIDNIFFVTLDFALNFNPEESAYGIIADYIKANQNSCKDTDRESILESLKSFAPEYIMNAVPDAFFKILDNISTGK